MFSLRNLTRIAPVLRNFKSETIVLQSLALRTEPKVYAFQPIRSYAKGKDKGKEKGKKAAKVEVNEEQLSAVVNVTQLRTQLDKALATMKDEFVKNLSLRSTTGAIETLKVNADGKEFELQEIGQIIRKNPKTIVINLLGFPQLIPQVLTTLNKSGMNLNPQQDGTTVFIPVPKITKEHRENLAKSAKALFIKCRDSLKEVQNNHLKKIKGNKEISSDLNHQLQQQITAIAEQHIAEADKLLQVKQGELLAVKE
jgi:ribosome recycling factor